MQNRTFALSEAIGCPVIYATAVFLHFVYPLFGSSALTIVFGAVNESVWEHVKIFSAGYVGYALFQLMWIRVSFRRYVVAKCAGLYLLMGGIIGSHYLFRFFLGKTVFWIDILSSAFVVILAQAASFLLTVSRKNTGEFFMPALFLLMLYYLMFFSFTIYPPKTELFRDPLTGGFGRMEEYVEKSMR